ncbi:HlyD family efflux transporter periplasmic adaptor subunit [Azospirillum canadense]|uniref:HlyD family efflux transporter periplasmic adaptor subunit n=1 Tax=Azospirillum canadense TaxID=403962 RepID=UPI00222701C3|nr:HlyD family efflux transporter periplasmic adaptor subunit [Azospirillum canadense]MCW2242492.1 putative peptide zinc metalloprotease protein [Azospirillum canadense]
MNAAAITTAAVSSVRVDAPPRMPPLREELILHPGPRAPGGAPTWTLQDPSSNRFFRIGWAELEMLARWDRGTPDAIAAAVSAETTLRVSPGQVEGFARFLWTQGLLQAFGDGALGRLKAHAAAAKPPFLTWLLHTYLSFRIPLVRPDRFLRATMPLVALLYTRLFLALTVLAALVGGALVLRQWDAFLGTFPHFFTLEGAALAGLVLGGAKLAHELGHAYTARRFGCRVPSMGIVFLVLWPVPYTDVTDAWRLVSRRQRLAIGAAGMAAELVLAAYATLVWSFLPDGPLRSVAFLLAGSTWLLTLAVNLNPLMRFDGYFLLSDWLDVPNLQDRAFALARWRLRETLFGLGEAPPEALPAHKRRVMLAYAYATWLYRFFLFLGIALLVYHLFFKLLGLFLMMVEIGWFILRPIQKELKAWAERRARFRPNRRLAVTVAAALTAVGLLLVPWRGTVNAPAVLRAEQQASIFVPKGARLVEVGAVSGGAVEAGQPLFRFDSPDLAHDRAQAERKAEVARWRTEVQSLDRSLLERTQAGWRELEAAQAEARGLAEEEAKLTVTAPFAGVVQDVADPLSPGEWLPEGMKLATVVSPRSPLIEAYVAEEDLARVPTGASGAFLADAGEDRWIPARVVAIAATSSRTLPEPAVASVYGGTVPTRITRGDVLVPESPVYRVLLRPEEGAATPARITRGMVRMDGAAESMVARLWRIAVGVVLRESGW